MLTPIVSAEQMHALDRAAIEEDGLPSLVLMERAGQGVYEWLGKWFTPVQDKRVAVVCGKGNNAGDGLVVARYLFEAGIHLQVYLALPPDEFTGDAAAQWRIVQSLNVPAMQFPSPIPSDCFAPYDIIVDALLGTGVQGEVKEPFRTVIEAVNRSGKPVVAIDIPSGLNADTGHAMGVTVQADYTVTMALPKRGFFLSDGVRCTGKWQAVDIGIPRQRIQSCPCDMRLLSDEFVRAHLPNYTLDAHKGTRGHVLVVGGAFGMAGAPALAGISTLRTGAGLVSVAVPATIQPTAAGYYPEIMTIPLPDEGQGVLTPEGVGVLLPHLDRFDCLALGTGISQAPPVGAAVRRLLDQWYETGKPLLVDADGLNWLARYGSEIFLNTNTVLTPHPGEAARLLGVSVPEIQSDRLSAVQLLQERYRCTILLKGAYTLIADGSQVLVNPFALPALGTAGSGDVLSGMVAGLLAQRLSPCLAAAAGAYLHAQAANRLLEEGSHRFTAGDLSGQIPSTLAFSG
jgi:NAD(P)H-hydrate epimerase